MEQLKAVGWTFFEDEYPTKKYQDMQELNSALTAVRNAIVQGRYMFAGEDHQMQDRGVPVLSDGTAFRCSMRVWGNIMASIYLKPNGERFSYMDFYMSIGDNCRMPPASFINVQPAQDIETSWGCTNQEDGQMVMQSIQMGMTFITTDKVLQDFYNQVSAIYQSEE